MIPIETLRRAVRAALEEDLGPGDLTSRMVVGEEAGAMGRIVTREPIVISGLEVARAVFAEVDARVRFDAERADGEAVGRGTVLARLTGRARSLLAGERTALNFLQRMSGIATATRRLVDLAGDSPTAISDTRKTAPLLRAFDKEAVRAGGGSSHRAGLFDAVLIKDNHCRLIGGVGEAVRRARRSMHERDRGALPVEVEVGSLEELREALEAGADWILLDNMEPALLEAAVAEARGRACLEVSGGV
ncbi:MAG TPA: carboxylating nicotinate-nucleotide diphosphorylase, partial [Candidatus Polarisedimenticolia bacterium]|nr:carboxylating nicotinate-nucleotide diphosphorylase [Candidatus Polarisedimenticolia bacterium]